MHAGYDHFPVAVDLCAALSAEGQANKCIDVEQLHTPEGRYKAECIFAQAPAVAWHVDVDQHLSQVNSDLAEAFSTAFQRSKRPRNPAISDTTWRIVAQRRSVRRVMARNRTLEDRRFLHTLLQAWRLQVRAPAGISFAAASQQRRTSLLLNRARLAKVLRELNQAFKQAVRRDEADFTRRMFDQAREEGPSQLHSLLRAVLKTGRRYKVPRFSPCLRINGHIVEDPTQVKTELVRRFARAEKAEEVSFFSVQRQDSSRVSTDSVEIAGMPTVAQVASAFASMKGRKAPGIAGLPPDIFKACPVAASYLHAPIF